MNIVVSDQGDESVGLFGSSYTIETPISETDDIDEIELFREMVIDVYSNFAHGKVTAFYQWEIDKRENEYLENELIQFLNDSE